VSPSEAVVRVAGVSLTYGRTLALDDVSFALPAGEMVGFIGPDGVGKSSLLALISGARQAQSGEIFALGGDMRSASHRELVCPRIAYMPQGLGKNLYADLSVSENVDFFGRLFGQARAERERRIAELLEATELSAFADRPAGKLSGGMRQKLGLCCCLIHDPDLLILDEPTTGVDPLSRRQFWDLIERMRARRPGMSVIVATGYMEEAERFDWLVAMNAGKVLATGRPADVRGDKASLEDAFIELLPEAMRRGHRQLIIPPRVSEGGAPIIQAKDLTCRFGDFVAVDSVSFTIERGEIFGFLGSNGCGKTTTMKMLTGLIAPSAGEAMLFGQPLVTSDVSARERVGYMSQAFSLYTELTVRQNLELHAHIFHLGPERTKRRLDELVAEFGLAPYLDDLAEALPLGMRQRLSLAVAIVHEPEILILDEPTSGVDPLARDAFWEALIDLSRRRGVTIFVSTHFMNEAARCDRIALMNAGRVLGAGAPAELVRQRGVKTLEDAFISYLEEATRARGTHADIVVPAQAPPPEPRPKVSAFSFRRLIAYALRESLELLRDPVRLGFSLFGTALLMLVFGFGVSTDVNNLSIAVLDHDQSSQSRAYLGEMRGSTYFVEKAPLVDYADLDNRLRSGAIKAAIEIPPGFGRDLERGRPVSVGAWVDGAMPFRAETIRGYLQGMHALYLTDPNVKTNAKPRAPAADIEVRFKYNQDFDSIYAMVPSNLALMLGLFSALLMALGVVREKELGSIVNLYVTPVRRVEFVIGKQLPYIAVGLVNFGIILLMALFVFQVPLKGGFGTLLAGVLLYLIAMTGYGMFVSSFARTQIAALFGTSILTVLPATQFAGMMTPVSSLAGGAQLIGRLFPMSYFVPISVGTFTKGLNFSDLWPNLVALALFAPALTLINVALLRKQER
jgi:ribosome-dependent ATPase